ncbi:MAG: hypothetical protein HWE20_17050 [Gammaproteobacteria bacterium]|nr:hypothetical protein [Gammaproteobacteria bacterium]
MPTTAVSPEQEFICLDRLYRWVDGSVDATIQIWELSESLAHTPIESDAIFRALSRKRLITYVPPHDGVRLTQIGVAMVLLAHQYRHRETAYFPALERFSTVVPLLITDGSMASDNLREMTVQLDGMIAALEGTWSERIDLTQLIDELDLRLWHAKSFPYFAIDDLSEIADILAGR